MNNISLDVTLIGTVAECIDDAFRLAVILDLHSIRFTRNDSRFLVYPDGHCIELPDEGGGHLVWHRSTADGTWKNVRFDSPLAIIQP